MIKIKKYHDGVIAKMLNRRIILIDNKDHTIGLQFAILDGDISARVSHNVIRNKIVVSSMKLSEEAAQALYISLYEHFNKTKFKPVHKDSI